MRDYLEVYKIVKGFANKYAIEIPEVIIDEMVDELGAIAVALWGEDSNGYGVQAIFLSPAVQYFREEALKEIIHHEVLHIVTLEGDDGKLFQELCKENEVPFTNEKDLEELVDIDNHPDFLLDFI